MLTYLKVRAVYMGETQTPEVRPVFKFSQAL